MSQPNPTPQTYRPPNANPTLTAKETEDLTKRRACAAKSSIQPVAFPHISSLFHTNLTRLASIQDLLRKPNVSAIATYRGRRGPVADGCERYNKHSRTRVYPQTPKVKRYPSLRIWEKHIGLKKTKLFKLVDSISDNKLFTRLTSCKAWVNFPKCFTTVRSRQLRSCETTSARES